MARKYQELRSKMSPERRARNKARTDVYVGTLRRYAEALGGELEIICLRDDVKNVLPLGGLRPLAGSSRSGDKARRRD